MTVVGKNAEIKVDENLNVSITADYVIDAWTDETVRKTVKYGVNFDEYSNEMFIMALEQGELAQGDSITFDASCPTFRYHEDTNQFLEVVAINDVHIHSLLMRQIVSLRVRERRQAK